VILVEFFIAVCAFEIGCELTRALTAALYGAHLRYIKWWPHKWHDRRYLMRVVWEWHAYRPTVEARQMVYFSPICILLPAIFLFGYVGTWESFAIFAAAIVVFLHELWSGQLLRLRIVPQSFVVIATLAIAMLFVLALGLVLL
jgi:hypothetical protein